MGRSNGNGFEINLDRLARICQLANDEFVGQRYLSGIKQFLPEFNLPQDLDYNPPRVEVPDPLAASQYLFLLVSMERKTLSRENIRRGQQTWQDTSKRWIFNPLEVVNRSYLEIALICKNDLKYSLDNFPSRYGNNCLSIAREYGGDPRKIVQGKTVEEARQILMSLSGIGTGIANLYIHYLMDRHIAFPSDPESALLKVDVHKTRIPLNTDSVTIQGNTIRRDSLVSPLETAYWEVCREYGLDASLLDSALWVIGSEICAERNYDACKANCPLESLCKSYVPEDETTGMFTVYKTGINGQRSRVDLRKGAGQKDFFR